jgi:DNA-binding CsgD family transcriptional regulator
VDTELTDTRREELMTSTTSSSVPDPHHGARSGLDPRDSGARLGVVQHPELVGEGPQSNHQSCMSPDDGVEVESDVARAGLPVIERLAEDLGDVAVRIELKDARANMIGSVASAQRVVATGGQKVACVAAPIMDPRCDGPVGAVGVVCAVPHAGALMLAYAQLAARTIADRMIDCAEIGDRVLMERFLRARRHARGPVLAVNRNDMLTNAAAARLVKPTDHPRIWRWAMDADGASDEWTAELRLGAQTVTARCEVVRTGRVAVGTLVYIESFGLSLATRRGRHDRPAGRPTFGWESLRPAELGIAELVAEGLTNREIGARIFLSPHTVDSHLRHVYRKLSINTRSELTRLVIEQRNTNDAAETLAG